MIIKQQLYRHAINYEHDVLFQHYIGQVKYLTNNIGTHLENNIFTC